LDDVGSVVFVDGVASGKIQHHALSLPEVSVVLKPGDRLVEVQKDGVTTSRTLLHVSDKSGVIPIAARSK